MPNRIFVSALSLAMILLAFGGGFWLYGGDHTPTASFESSEPAPSQELSPALHGPMNKDVSTQTMQTFTQQTTIPPSDNIVFQKADDSPWYALLGTVVSVRSRDGWFDATLKIEQYESEPAPPQEDVNTHIGAPMIITFHPSTDPGPNRLQVGQHVIINTACFVQHLGRIVWGSEFNNVYYLQGNDYINPQGKIFDFLMKS